MIFLLFQSPHDNGSVTVLFEWLKIEIKKKLLTRAQIKVVCSN